MRGIVPHAPASPAAAVVPCYSSTAMNRGSEAFSAEFEAVAPSLFAWVVLRLPSEVRSLLEPEDVLQEVACRAFEQIDRFDAAVGSFRSWAFGIARNVLREALRFLARHPTRKGSDQLATEWIHQVPDPATSISRRVVRDESLRRVVERLARLPEDDRRLLLYRGLEGLEHGEVGRILGVTVEAAEKRWQRLRDRLHELGLPDGLIAA